MKLSDLRSRLRASELEPDQRECPTCNGIGTKRFTRPTNPETCHHCKGKGVIHVGIDPGYGDKGEYSVWEMGPDGKKRIVSPTYDEARAIERWWEERPLPEARPPDLSEHLICEATPEEAHSWRCKGTRELGKSVGRRHHEQEATATSGWSTTSRLDEVVFGPNTQEGDGSLSSYVVLVHGDGTAPTLGKVHAVDKDTLGNRLVNVRTGIGSAETIEAERCYPAETRACLPCNGTGGRMEMRSPPGGRTPAREFITCPTCLGLGRVWKHRPHPSAEPDGLHPAPGAPLVPWTTTRKP